MTWMYNVLPQFLVYRSVVDAVAKALDDVPAHHINVLLSNRRQEPFDWMWPLLWRLIIERIIEARIFKQAWKPVMSSVKRCANVSFSLPHPQHV